jgi:phosphotransacetylase
MQQNCKRNGPDITYRWRVWADAAIVESIGMKKCPDSPIAGKANVLIFPTFSQAISATSWFKDLPELKQ